MNGAAGTARRIGAAVRAVADAVEAAGVPAFLVGGAVRDDLLGRATRDVDVAVEAGPDRLARLLDALEAAGFAPLARHERFGTATLAWPDGLRLDVAATRREVYPRPAALPVVTTGVSLAEDLARRDFTIHAMARRLETGGKAGALVDPHGGARDVAAGTLRLLHDLSLVDDPTRIFRAARYAARLGFAVAPEFASQLDACRAAGALDALSPDRLRRALEEVLAEAEAPAALDLLGAWGVLHALAPGLARWRASRASVPDAVPAVGWADLFGALAEQERQALAVRLNFSRALRRSVGLGR